MHAVVEQRCALCDLKGTLTRLTAHMHLSQMAVTRLRKRVHLSLGQRRRRERVVEEVKGDCDTTAGLLPTPTVAAWAAPACASRGFSPAAVRVFRWTKAADSSRPAAAAVAVPPTNALWLACARLV